MSLSMNGHAALAIHGKEKGPEVTLPLSVLQILMKVVAQ